MALKCHYTNCLSLINKLPELCQIAFDQKPHILALTETWLNTSILDSEVDIPGYSIYRSNSLRGSMGGVALYLSHSLPNLITVKQVQHTMFDSVWIKIPLRKPDCLLIGVIYRSPSSSLSDDELAMKYIKDTTDSFSFSNLLLMGDFNAPKINWAQLRSDEQGFSEALVQWIKTRSWSQKVSFPTRFRHGNQPSLLDLILTNEAHFIDCVGQNPPVGLSDHRLLHF